MVRAAPAGRPLSPDPPADAGADRALSPEESIEALVDELLRRAETSQTLSLGGLMVARLLPLTFVAPFFGGRVAPAPVKLTLALALTVALFPAVRHGLAGPVAADSLVYVGLLLKELFLGFALAFIASLVFRAVEMAGQAVDVLRGANLATALVPQMGERASIFGDLWVQTLVVLFFLAGGHHLVLAALADSFVVIPVDALPAPAGGLWPAFAWIIELTGDLFRIAFALAAPALVVLFLADVVLGIAARVAPQIQVFFLGMPLKAVLAVAMILLATQALIGAFGGRLGDMLGDLRSFLDWFR